MTDDFASIAERRRFGIYVPDVENRVAERFGEDAARRLLMAFGSQIILLPKPPTPDHPIARELGFPVLEGLCQIYGEGNRLHIPTGCTNRRTKNGVRLRRLILDMAGCSASQIARASGYEERQVRRVRAAMRRQGLLPAVGPHTPAVAS
jgi:hypothetical protein